MLSIGKERNLCIFFRLLSKKIGIGKAVANFFRLTYLIFCKRLINREQSKYSERTSLLTSVYLVQ